MSSASIKLLTVKVSDPNHVGQDGQWYYGAKINNTSIEIGEEKRVETINEELRIYLEAYEKDKVADKGTLSKTFKYKDIQNQSINLNVLVTENRGQYAGNTATVSFSFQIS
jgi:hypothetical protein